MKARSYLAFLGVLAIAAIAASCTDPALDQAILALGDEPDQPGQGPLHRPGQPCVLCHQEGGNSGVHFAVAGTIYETDERNSAPAEGVQVLMVAANGSKPKVNGKEVVYTNSAGNFFVKTEDWADLEFPMHVQLYRDDVRYVIMSSHIGRDGSCAGCHRDPVKGVVNDKYSALGHVYLKKGAAP